VGAAEQRFLEKNLQLLAARLNIDATRATILQARLWNNPNLSIEQNIYNYQRKRYFDFTSEGNTEFAVQQLFLLAGKRGKQIRLAEINTEIAEDSFTDLLRSLKLELRSDLYDLYFLQQSLKFYDESVDALRKTVGSAENILEKRSILLSEVLRVKSLLFSLENERLGLLNKAVQIKWDLHVLLRDTADTYYIPQLDRQYLDGLSLDTLSLPYAMSLATLSRPDLRVALANLQTAETNLALQRALAVPDVTVGFRWSRAGSYIPDYYAFSVAIDLPILNRNQGNIQQAELALRATKASLDNTFASVEKDVATAYEKALSIDRLYKTRDPKFTSQYKDLAAGMLKTYENRNLSVIQFTDFFESFRTSVVQMNQLQNDRLDAFESLNFVTGTDVLNPK
jgi:outer membrane protein, heavy metal efflux system